MSLGQQILKLRKTKGWNQDTLGEKLGIHANHVSRLEHDRMKPSKRTLVRLAEVFEVDLDDLVASTQQVNIKDQQLLKAFQLAQELEGEDRLIVVRLIQALAAKKRMEQALRPDLE
jgi:transcriptional regulator with XRE-family HTH domain